MGRSWGVMSPSFAPPTGVASVGIMACTWSRARSHAALPICSAGLEEELPTLRGVRPLATVVFFGVRGTAPNSGVVGCTADEPHAGATWAPCWNSKGTGPEGRAAVGLDAAACAGEVRCEAQQLDPQNTHTAKRRSMKQPDYDQQ